MKTFFEWFKPGAKIKRYIFMQLISIALIIFSAITLFTRDGLDIGLFIAYVILLTLAIFMTIFSFVMAQRNILAISLKHVSNKDKKGEIRKLLYNENELKKGPKVVVLGGGSGLSNILRGIKEYTSNITAIVTTFDNGGSTGKLREELDVLAPGDIRKCITALSMSEPVMEDILAYRFKDNCAEGHSLGNLFLVAMTDITGSFPAAIEKISDIFSVRGRVLPVTLEKMPLCAGLENGDVVVGQVAIKAVDKTSRIKQIFLKEGECKPAPDVLDAIKDADLIVIGPGSLYTSIICNFLVSGVADAIVQSKAKKMYVCNLMTQPGETDGYTLAKHINEVERYLGKHVLDYCVVNNGEITSDMLKDFNQGMSKSIRLDLENIQNRTISVIQDDYVLTAPNAILHDNQKIGELIIEVTKKRKSGKLNLLKIKRKHKSNTKKVIKDVAKKNSDSDKNNIKDKMKDLSNKFVDTMANISDNMKNKKDNKKKRA